MSYPDDFRAGALDAAMGAQSPALDAHLARCEDQYHQVNRILSDLRKRTIEARPVFRAVAHAYRDATADLKAIVPESIDVDAIVAEVLETLARHTEQRPDELALAASEDVPSWSAVEESLREEWSDRYDR